MLFKILNSRDDCQGQFPYWCLVISLTNLTRQALLHDQGAFQGVLMRTLWALPKARFSSLRSCGPMGRHSASVYMHKSTWEARPGNGSQIFDASVSSFSLALPPHCLLIKVFYEYTQWSLWVFSNIWIIENFLMHFFLAIIILVTRAHLYFHIVFLFY